MAESLSETPTLDPRSPYYPNPDFQSNFDPPTVILSQAEDNYVYWKIRFLDFLRLANKIGFIDGTLAKPDPASPLYEPWEQCDAIVKCWLMSSMTEEILSCVAFAETAHEMWRKIRGIFVPSVDLKIYQVRRKIATMSQDGDSVSTYYGKLNKAWMELSEYDPVPACACGGCRCEIAKQAREARQKEKLYPFLVGLNKSLSNVARQILRIEPLPSIHQAYIMVEQEESMMKTRR